MSTPTITRVKLFTSAVALLATAAAYAEGEWKVDFSRRQQVTRSDDLRAPAATDQPIAGAPEPSFFESLFQTGDIAQEIVVLHTDTGFVPNTLRVKKGLNYKIHVVNVNEKEKNVSFVLDSFSEHHATFYGKIKSFIVRPQKEGVYRFVSPETSAQGKIVVFPGGPENRLPASE